MPKRHLFCNTIFYNILFLFSSGQLAPFAMLLSAIALMPFRGIFKECGTAVPMVSRAELYCVVLYVLKGQLLLGTGLLV